MTYNVFVHVHEDALEWLLDVEDALEKLEPPATDDLDRIRVQSHSTGLFMEDVRKQHGAIGEVGVLRGFFVSFYGADVIRAE